MSPRSSLRDAPLRASLHAWKTVIFLAGLGVSVDELTAVLGVHPDRRCPDAAAGRRGAGRGPRGPHPTWRSTPRAVLGTLLDLPRTTATSSSTCPRRGCVPELGHRCPPHPNTVCYRLRRIQADTGRSLTIQATSPSSSPPSAPGASCRTRSDSSDRPGADQAGHACGSGRSGE